MELETFAPRDLNCTFLLRVITRRVGRTSNGIPGYHSHEQVGWRLRGGYTCCNDLIPVKHEVVENPRRLGRIGDGVCTQRLTTQCLCKCRVMSCHQIVPQRNGATMLEQKSLGNPSKVIKHAVKCSSEEESL